jgi:hypothetical protein
VTTSNSAQLTPHTSPAVTRAGQATLVEQSRAVAEVQAAIVVAQNCPRSVARAIAQMRESCAQQALAERAFFRYSRGGSTVSGPSVHLARDLARTWGNVQFGIAEMVRDDDRGQSEMLAFAWDVETNTRSSNTFIVPHVRDTRDGAKQLTDMRDIYENNANNGARRVREAIFSILPPWFVEEAKDLCNKTLSDGGGKPLVQRVADAIKAFSAIGVTEGQLATKLGGKPDTWAEHDVAQLQVIYKSLQRGEISKDEEFPAESARITVAELIGGGAKPSVAAVDPVAQEPAAPAAPDKSPATRASLGKALARMPLGQPEDVGEFMAWRTGRPVAALADLAKEEIIAIDGYLERVLATADGDPPAAAEAIWAEYRAEYRAAQQALADAP